MQNFLAQDSKHLAVDTAVANAATLNSTAIEMQNFKGACFQLNITGTPTAGTFKLQESNDGVNYVDISGATVAVSAVGTKILTVKDVYADKVRAVYIATTGAVVVNIFAQAK